MKTIKEAREIVVAEIEKANNEVLRAMIYLVSSKDEEILKRLLDRCKDKELFDDIISAIMISMQASAKIDAEKELAKKEEAA